MKGVIKFCMLTLFLATACTPERFNEAKRGVQVKYVGSIECKEWMAGKSDDPSQREKFNWILGFLSGLAVSEKKDFISVASNGQIYDMVTKRCGASSYKTLGTIAYEIEIDLKNRR